MEYFCIYYRSYFCGSVFIMKRKNKYETLIQVYNYLKKNRLKSYYSIAKKLGSNWDTIKSACDCLYELGLIKQFISEDTRKKWFAQFSKLTKKQQKEIFKELKLNQ